MSGLIKISNFLLFQAGWWLAAYHERLSVWPAIVVAIVMLGMVMIREKSKRPLLFICMGTLTGIAVDSFLLSQGIFQFSAAHAGFLIPFWLMLIWLMFAITILTSMQWLNGRPLLAAILGAVFGPLSYYAGEKMGVLSFHDPKALSLTLLAVIWAALMPALTLLSSRVPLRENHLGHF